jgi:uncharacterized protein (DUF433 family)
MDDPKHHIHIVNGVARTINKNVKVKMIASALLGGQTPDQIADHYGITPADVFYATAYYFDNLDDYQKQEQRNRELLGKYGVRSEDVLAQMRSRIHEE